MPTRTENDQSHAYALLTAIQGAKVYGIPVALVSSAVAAPILFTSSGSLMIVHNISVISYDIHTFSKANYSKNENQAMLLQIHLFSCMIWQAETMLTLASMFYLYHKKLLQSPKSLVSQFNITTFLVLNSLILKCKHSKKGPGFNCHVNQHNITKERNQ